MFTDLDHIAAMRDRSAHAGGEPPAQDELEQIADEVLDLAAWLIELQEKATTQSPHA